MFLRKEMTEVMFASPLYCVTPTGFRGFSDHFIVDFKRKVRLRLQRFNSLRKSGVRSAREGLHDMKLVHTVFMGRNFATFGSVNTPTLVCERQTRARSLVASSRTFRAFMFLRSMPTSAVTPSPNRRFAAATCENISLWFEQGWSEIQAPRICH